MKVIDYKNKPATIPLQAMIVAYLLLEHLKSPDWVYGAVITFFVILCFQRITRIVNQEIVDIFKEK